MRSLKIICAPDSYKGTLSATDAASAMARGARQALKDAGFGPDEGVVIEQPLSDGGEGFLDALAHGKNGVRWHAAEVTGPLGQPVRAKWLEVPDDEAGGRAGVVEFAEAGGWRIGDRQGVGPMGSTSFGVGELIRSAIEAGCGTVLVGLGGSATCDGGLPIAQALGVRFFAGGGRDGAEMREPITGRDLGAIARIEMGSALLEAWRERGGRLLVAADVRNPLLGEHGAARTFAPQKGASPEDVEVLEAGLRHVAGLIEGADLKRAGDSMMGSAGGASYGLAMLCGAEVVAGAELVLERIGFDGLLDAEKGDEAVLVLTGEGKLDATTASGKVMAGLLDRVRGQAQVDLIAIVGEVEGEAPIGFADVISLSERFGKQESMERAAACIEQAAGDAVRAIMAGG